MNTTIIQLTRGYTSVIDSVDEPLVSQHLWSALIKEHGVYAQANCKGVTLRMHRLILDAPRGVLVDHVNGDSLDNRRSNLRLCTSGDNTKNRRKPRSGTSSRYKGVHWAGHVNKYAAYIVADGRQNYLGVFLTEEEAARAYDDASRSLCGEFARLNFPNEGEQGCLTTNSPSTHQTDSQSLRTVVPRRAPLPGGIKLLTEDTVERIHQLSVTMTQKEISQLFNIQYKHVNNILRGVIWRRVYDRCHRHTDNIQ